MRRLTNSNHLYIGSNVFCYSGVLQKKMRSSLPSPISLIAAKSLRDLSQGLEKAEKMTSAKITVMYTPHTPESKNSIHYRPDPDSPDYPAWEAELIKTAKEMAEIRKIRIIK